jgi:hypothetical protein
MFSAKAQQYNVAIGRYVIMPDHVPLFAGFPIDGITLPSWVQSLRNALSARNCSRFKFRSRIGNKAFSIIFCAKETATCGNGNTAHEPSAHGTVRHTGGLAIPRRNSSHSL